MTPRRLMIFGALALALPACASGGAAAPPTAPSTDAPTTTAAPTTTSSTSTTSTTSATTTTTSSTSSSSTTTTTLPPPPPRQPLNGEILDDASEIIDRPALAVKIDNVGPARSRHTGLAVADIVFEEIVEGSATRFAAVFHSQGSDPVGPIRSGRTQDVDMLKSYNRPLFAWSGGNANVERAIAESTMIDLKHGTNGGAYWRGAGSAPHNLYSSTDRLWERTPDDHPGPPAQQFAYLPPGAEFEGEPVDGFSVAMRGNSVSWDWDPESERFMRSQGGSPHNDVQHGQIGAKNVVVMVVYYRPSAADARSPEAITVGDVTAYVFSDGQVVPGRWSRASADEVFHLRDANNKTIPLVPGNTWIELAEAIPTGDPDVPDDNVTIRWPD